MWRNLCYICLIVNPRPALSLDHYIPFSCIVSEKCIKETINAVCIGVIIDIIDIRKICASIIVLMLMYIILFSGSDVFTLL